VIRELIVAVDDEARASPTPSSKIPDRRLSTTTPHSRSARRATREAG
jgi:hypothetical protein